MRRRTKPGTAFEFPPGSGAVATYDAKERAVIREILASADSGAITRAQALRDIGLIHECKVALDARIVDDLDEPPVALDGEASRLAAENGIRRVARGTDPSWAETARAAVATVARNKPIFTPDDIWLLVPKPSEPRALGPIMRWAVAEGLCRPTGDYVKSSIPTQHQNPITEYASLVHRRET